MAHWMQGGVLVPRHRCAKYPAERSAALWSACFVLNAPQRVAGVTWQTRNCSVQMTQPQQNPAAGSDAAFPKKCSASVRYHQHLS